MSRILFVRLACLALPLFFNSARAQPDRFTYAVTAVNKGGSDWVALRKLDIRTGEFGKILLKVLDNDTASSVAAIAYDRRANRLFFAPMNIDQLRYIDLSSFEIHAVSDQFFSKTGKYDFKNAGPINRMVIAPDDYGYTITNDGTHLLRFNTKGSPVITDLGDLVDDPMNKEWTIHSICANSGGDMIADDAGHLYLVTGSNKIFKVDIASKVSTYITTVSGLPQKFTTSGVAVSENGRQLIVNSSAYSDAYFLVDPETWIASPAASVSELYESADLANSNILITKNANSSLFESKYDENRNAVRIFPNPVMDDMVSVQFNGLPPGNYRIQLADLLGTKIKEQKVILKSESQTEAMHVPRFATQAFYYIRILDERNNVVSTQKLVVERW